MMRTLWIVPLLCGCSTPRPQSENRPNIVFILADDLGSGDVGCTGAQDIRTPAIDRLAAEGVRFTRFYSNGPECTPTRTALLTGRYQHRVGGLECAIGSGNVGRYDDAIRLREKDELGLPASETSLARLIRGAGYATAAIGKWHLGYEKKFFPDAHGFDEWFGPLGGGVDYFHHTEPDGKLMLYRNGEPAKREGYLTDLISEEAVAYVKRAHTKPYFLYVPYTAPHLPGQGPNDRPEKPLEQQGWNKSNRQTHAAMVERMDRGIGEILRAVGTSNTLVIFTSDNGATGPGSNGPLSGKKGTLWEGGIRVPCIARWPGTLPAGRTSDQVTLTMDLTSSLVRIAGARPDRAFDGIDALALHAAPIARTVFWRARRGRETWRAARQGDLKYLSHEVTDRGIEEHLFDLAADPGEKRDLLAMRGTDVQRLKSLLRDWESEVRHSR